jgi:uncharacterized protein
MNASTSAATTNYPANAARASFVPNVIDWVALALVVIGGLNWGLVGAFGFDLVAAIFGDMTTASRAVYVLVGLAALYSISFFARLPKHR